jgi:hypothetical protein
VSERSALVVEELGEVGEFLIEQMGDLTIEAVRSRWFRHVLKAATEFVCAKNELRCPAPSYHLYKLYAPDDVPWGAIDFEWGKPEKPQQSYRTRRTYSLTVEGKVGFAYQLGFKGKPVSKLRASLDGKPLKEGKHFVADLPVNMVHLKALPPRSPAGAKVTFEIDVLTKMMVVG